MNRSNLNFQEKKTKAPSTTNVYCILQNNFLFWFNLVKSEWKNIRIADESWRAASLGACTSPWWPYIGAPEVLEVPPRASSHHRRPQAITHHHRIKKVRDTAAPAYRKPSVCLRQRLPLPIIQSGPTRWTLVYFYFFL